MKICCVPECGSKMHANGLCSKHAHRRRRNQPVWTWRETFIKDNPPNNGIGYIPLTNGKVAIVDEPDYRWLIKREWHYAKRGDVCCNSVDEKGNKHMLKMHRLITNCPKHLVVDHIDLNPLNNRRLNLRFATKSQNAANSKVIYSATGIRGVYKHGPSFTYRMRHMNKVYTKSGFKTPIQAAEARDKLGKQLFGEYYRPSLGS